MDYSRIIQDTGLQDDGGMSNGYGSPVYEDGQGTINEAVTVVKETPALQQTLSILQPGTSQPQPQPSGTTIGTVLQTVADVFTQIKNNPETIAAAEAEKQKQKTKRTVAIVATVLTICLLAYLAFRSKN